MTDFETLKAEYDKQCLQVEDLKAAGRKSSDDAISALDLLGRVRFALGDNGTRMQDELIAYCRELAKLQGRRLLPYCPRCCRIAPADIHTCHPTPEWQELEAERDRYRAALAEMSDELSHYPEGDGIFGHLKRILRRALA